MKSHTSSEYDCFKGWLQIFEDFPDHSKRKLRKIYLELLSMMAEDERHITTLSFTLY
jgi:hypothetical protein